MDKLQVTFSNSETLILQDGDTIIPIKESGITPDEENPAPALSMQKTYPLQYHHHEGFIVSFLELCNYCKYFYLNDNKNKVFFTNAIVNIERV